MSSETVEKQEAEKETRKMSVKRNPKQKRATLCVSLALGAVVLLFLMSLASFHSAEARYLPTRADESDVEVLKSLIKELLVQANMEQMEARMNRLQGANPAMNSMAGHLAFQRRSAEMPQYANSDSSQRTVAGRMD